MPYDRYAFMTPEHREECQIRDRIEWGGTCCEKGERFYCFCRASCRCPVHGWICIGSHD